MRRLLGLVFIAGCTQILGVGGFHETGGDGGVPGSDSGTDGGGSGVCSPGDSRSCYDGPSGTQGVGACKAGAQMCDLTDTWGSCSGEVTPVPEVCGDGIDNNCNGMVDESPDDDGDGFTVCDGDCCDNTTECPDPAEVNPGAYDVPGDGIDNDCDGIIDDTNPCDSALAGLTDADSFAKAIDICRTTTAGSARWGLISAGWSSTDGEGSPNSYQDSIMTGYGTGVTPMMGSALGVLSTGHADATTNPQTDAEPSTDTAIFPADFYAADDGQLPHAPGCPLLQGTAAIDPVMLTLQIKVPTNASSFTMDASFYSADFPGYVCTQYNDYFVVLLDSSYAGSPANPSDKNLAFYSPDMGTTKYPVGVNLAMAGKFTQCENGPIGCDGTTTSQITSCTGIDELQGTSFGSAGSGSLCGSDDLDGGATGWLQIRGNVQPGEVMTLRIAIWNTTDGTYQSLVLLDSFAWHGSAVTPGADLLVSSGSGSSGGSGGGSGSGSAGDHCEDGVMDDGETDIDCGGTCDAEGRTCSSGQMCVRDNDCMLSLCVSTTCF